jgi:hypothetical protein
MVTLSYKCLSNLLRPLVQQPQWATASTLSRIHDYTQTHQKPWDSSGRVISQTYTPVLDNTQNRHPCHSGIRTCNPSNRAATDRRFRLRGHLHQRRTYLLTISLIPLWGSKMHTTKVGRPYPLVTNITLYILGPIMQWNGQFSRNNFFNSLSNGSSPKAHWCPKLFSLVWNFYVQSPLLQSYILWIP